MAAGTFTVSCNFKALSSVLRHSRRSERRLRTHEAVTPPRGCWPLVCYLSPRLGLLWTFPVSAITQHVDLLAGSFPWRFRRFTQVAACIGYGCITSRWRDRPRLAYSFAAEGHLGGFPLWGRGDGLLHIFPVIRKDVCPANTALAKPLAHGKAQVPLVDTPRAGSTPRTRLLPLDHAAALEGGRVYPCLSVCYRRGRSREVLTCHGPLLLRDTPRTQSPNRQGRWPPPALCQLLQPEPHSGVHVEGLAHTVNARRAQRSQDRNLAPPGSRNLPASCHPALWAPRPPTAPLGVEGRNPHGLTWERPVKIF